MKAPRPTHHSGPVEYVGKPGGDKRGLKQADIQQAPLRCITIMAAGKVQHANKFRTIEQQVLATRAQLDAQTLKPHAQSRVTRDAPRASTSAGGPCVTNPPRDLDAREADQGFLRAKAGASVP